MFNWNMKNFCGAASPSPLFLWSGISFLWRRVSARHSPKGTAIFYIVNDMKIGSLRNIVAMLVISVDPRGIGPRPRPCHGRVIPLNYGPFVDHLNKTKTSTRVRLFVLSAGSLPRLNFCRRKSLSGHRLTACQAWHASFRRSIPTHAMRRHCALGQTHFVRLLSAGIEPASAPSEGAILSIERREQSDYLSTLSFGLK